MIRVLQSQKKHFFIKKQGYLVHGQKKQVRVKAPVILLIFFIFRQFLFPQSSKDPTTMRTRKFRLTSGATLSLGHVRTAHSTQREIQGAPNCLLVCVYLSVSNYLANRYDSPFHLSFQQFQRWYISIFGEKCSFKNLKFKSERVDYTPLASSVPRFSEGALSLVIMKEQIIFSFSTHFFQN